MRSLPVRSLHFLPLKTVSTSPLTFIFFRPSLPCITISIFLVLLFYIFCYLTSKLEHRLPSILLFLSLSVVLSTLRLFLRPFCLSFFLSSLSLSLLFIFLFLLFILLFSRFRADSLTNKFWVESLSGCQLDNIPLKSLKCIRCDYIPS